MIHDNADRLSGYTVGPENQKTGPGRGREAFGVSVRARLAVRVPLLDLFRGDLSSKETASVLGEFVYTLIQSREDSSFGQRSTPTADIVVVSVDIPGEDARRDDDIVVSEESQDTIIDLREPADLLDHFVQRVRVHTVYNKFICNQVVPKRIRLHTAYTAISRLLCVRISVSYAYAVRLSGCKQTHVTDQQRPEPHGGMAARLSDVGEDGRESGRPTVSLALTQ